MSQVITLAEAANISNNVLVQGIIADIVTVDQWFKYLPFVMFEGLNYSFTREKKIGKAAFAAPGTSLAAAKYQAGAEFQPVAVSLSAIIAEIILDGHIQDQLSETNSQLMVQISSKSKNIARTYMNAIVNGRKISGLSQGVHGLVGIAESFDGMAAILDAEQGNADDVNHPFYNAGASTQTLALIEDDESSARYGKAGRVYSLEDLDDLIDRVTGAAPDFLMMNDRSLRILRTLLRNTGGGTDAGMIQSAGLGSAKPMLTYQDIPVFRNDFISRHDAVNTVALTLSSITDADTIVVSADPASTVGAGNVKHVLMRGSDGLMYRYPVANASTVTLDLTVTGQYFDPESNQMQSRMPVNTASLFTSSQEVLVAERIDGTSIYCGCWGEMKGVAGFTSSNNAGLKLAYVGPREDHNADQWRLKWYCGFDLYNRLNLARMKDVLPLGA